jgi:hypothetical protein
MLFVGFLVAIPEAIGHSPAGHFSHDEALHLIVGDYAAGGKCIYLPLADFEPHALPLFNPCTRYAYSLPETACQNGNGPPSMSHSRTPVIAGESTARGQTIKLRQ